MISVDWYGQKKKAVVLAAYCRDRNGDRRVCFGHNHKVSHVPVSEGSLTFFGSWIYAQYDIYHFVM